MRAPKNRILVQVAGGQAQTRTPSGLYIAQTNDDAQMISGTAISVGSDIEDVRSGETVHFNRLSVFKLKDSPAVFSLTPNDVLAIE